MKKTNNSEAKIASWYPSNDELVSLQRDQVLRSRQEAVAFAHQDFKKPAASWWRRLFGSRT